MSTSSNFSEKADEIRTSGKWADLDKKVYSLTKNHNGHDVEHVQVLSALHDQNLSEYHALKTAWESDRKDPSLIAWRARNLLEISVYSLYCAQSKENALRFYKDTERDASELYQKVLKWGENLSIGETWVAELRKSKDNIDVKGKYLSTREAAESCNIFDYYDVTYKVLSKFSHPTAISIVPTPDKEADAELSNMFYHLGCMSFVNAFDVLQIVVSGLVSYPER